MLGFAAGLGSSICVGLLFPLQKDLLRHLDPATLNWAEMVVALLLALSVMAIRPSERRVSGKGTAWYLALFGLIACMLFYMRNVGVQLTNATTGAVVIRTEVAMVMLLSYVILRVKPDLWGWLGAVLLFFGAALSLDLTLDALRFTPWGTTALFLSAAGIAVNALIIKTRFGDVSDAAVVASNTLVQTGVFSAIVLITGTSSKVVGAEPAVLMKVALGGAFIFAALYLYYRAMKLIPMWVTRSLSLLAPPVAAVVDHFWLGSPITRGQLSGLVAVTVGAALIIPCLTRAAGPGHTDGTTPFQTGERPPTQL